MMFHSLNTIPRLIDVLMHDFKPGGQDLNLTQQKVLLVVAQNESVSMSFLSRMLAMEKGSMTSVVDKLIQEAYLTRERNAEDRRQVLLGMTTKGDLAAAQIGEAMEAHLQRKFQALNEQEQGEFQQAIHTIQRMVEKLEQGY